MPTNNLYKIIESIMILLDNINKLKLRIENICIDCNRNPQSVELLPVSKGYPNTLIQEAISLGFNKFGENYVQEVIAKRNVLKGANFVLIGNLQYNKAKQALTNFQEIMTVDNIRLLKRLHLLSKQMQITCPLWIQANLWQEPTKIGGCNENEIAYIFQIIKENHNLPVIGFMVIPPPNDIKAFNLSANLRDKWQQNIGKSLKLSMGMSNDLDLAIKAGSDQVRIGTAFFKKCADN